MSLSPIPQSDSPGYPHNSNEELEARRHLARVADGLAELFALLENYAPAWYTEHHHEKALSALRVVKNLQAAK